MLNIDFNYKLDETLKNFSDKVKQIEDKLE